MRLAQMYRLHTHISAHMALGGGARGRTRSSLEEFGLTPRRDPNAESDTGKFGNATDYNICSQIMELRVGRDYSAVLGRGCLIHGDLLTGILTQGRGGAKARDNIATSLPQYPPLAELRPQVFHAAVALDGVAGVAEQLQVAARVQAALGTGRYVVYR